jgi:hypothetical protein
MLNPSKLGAFMMVAAGVLVSTTSLANAQDVRDVAARGANVPRSIVGVVYDSIAHRPLSGAHVHLADLGRDAVADSLGAFRFDSVGAGAHSVWADHPTLDVLGLYAIGAGVDATPQAVTHVTLAVPSFATLWRRACGSDPGPRNGEGMVFGQVRYGAVHISSSGTAIELAWHAVGPDSAGGPAGETRRKTQADAAGSYAICGIPARQTVTLSMNGGGTTTIPVSFRVGTARIARRDLTLPSSDAIEQLGADASLLAPVRDLDGSTLAGVVRDSARLPVHDARVTVSGVAGEWRVNANGGFVVRGIPSGTRVIAIRALGLAPERRLVDLAARDSAFLDLSMTRLITTLSTVTIREREHLNALRSDLDQRRRAGFGYRADSLELARLPGVMEAFNFPGVRTAWKLGMWGISMTGVYSIPSKGSSGITLSCNPTIWIDGAISDIFMLNELTKDEIALIEVYNSAARAPLQYASARSLCGVVLVWRKRYIDP